MTASLRGAALARQLLPSLKSMPYLLSSYIKNLENALVTLSHSRIQTLKKNYFANSYPNYRHSEDAVFKDRVHFVKFDVDELPAVTQALGVRAMPTFFFFKDGKKVDEMVGANPPALLEALKKIAA